MPDPGPRPVPPHAALLVAFANSRDREEGTDDLQTQAGLQRWLVEHDLIARSPRVTRADLALAHRLRDGLFRALIGNHDGVPDLASLAAVGVELPLRLGSPTTAAGVELPGSGPVPERPGPVLVPTRDGVPGALTRLLIAVASATADDTWRRLKICSEDTCAWAFFDASKNRSRTWCEWGCGNKVKTRNYRARRRQAAG